MSHCVRQFRVHLCRQGTAQPSCCFAHWRGRKHQGGSWEQGSQDPTFSVPSSQSCESVKVKVAQSCLTLWDPMDYTVHEILQARILAWVAFASSRGSSQSRDRTQVSSIAGGFFTSWATREALWEHASPHWGMQMGKKKMGHFCFYQPLTEL